MRIWGRKPPTGQFLLPGLVRGARKPEAHKLLFSRGIVPSVALRNGGFIVARNRVFELALPPLVLKRSADVAIGTVKWFNPMKGYGFIQPDKGGKDVFVHISAVEKAGFTGLAEGAKISFEFVSDRG